MEEKKELTQQEYDKTVKELYKREFEVTNTNRKRCGELQLMIDEINVKIKKLELERQEYVQKIRLIEQRIADVKAEYKTKRMEYKVITPKTEE